MLAKEQGATLKRTRVRKGYTQRELGLLSKCSHAMIGLLERGESSVGDALAARIAKRLDVGVEDLFEDRPVVRNPRQVEETRPVVRVQRQPVVRRSRVPSGSVGMRRSP